MKYTYDTYINSFNEKLGRTVTNRVDTTTNFVEVEAIVAHNQKAKDFNGFIIVFDNTDEKFSIRLQNNEEIEGWRVAQERAFAWKDKEIVEEAKLKQEWKPFEELEELTARRIETPVKPTEDPLVKDHINPSYYQSFFEITDLVELKWIEAKQHEGQFKDPIKFKAAVSLLIEKYLDRNGGKDKEEQELSKALWYMKFLVAYVKNGDRPIRVIDINDLLKGI